VVVNLLKALKKNTEPGNNVRRYSIVGSVFIQQGDGTVAKGKLQLVKQKRGIFKNWEILGTLGDRWLSTSKR
jgi:hypothetical protein